MATGNAPTLEAAIALALEAHQSQVDKAGQPYALHPLRLMLRASAGGGDLWWFNVRRAPCAIASEECYRGGRT